MKKYLFNVSAAALHNIGACSWQALIQGRQGTLDAPGVSVQKAQSLSSLS